uniref:Uncharacterized protein n=1 Tax=Triticum urartu TaxID=4572 RepID=A0A8R7R5P3_TRIUA
MALRFAATSEPSLLRRSLFFISYPFPSPIPHLPLQSPDPQLLRPVLRPAAGSSVR